MQRSDFPCLTAKVRAVVVSRKQYLEILFIPAEFPLNVLCCQMLYVQKNFIESCVTMSEYKTHVTESVRLSVFYNQN
jgi:hypothetical protein